MGSRTNCPTPGSSSDHSCTSLSTMKPAATIWPPSLVSASSSIRSSTTPTAQIIAPAISTIPGVVEDGGLRGAEERQVASDQQPRPEPAEHGHATEVGDRGRVHVAVAHAGHGTGPDRQLAGEDAQQVADDTGHEEDEQVLTHGPGRPPAKHRARGRARRRARSPALPRGLRGPAASSSTVSAPARRIRGRFPVQSRIVEAVVPGLGPSSRTTSTDSPSIRSAASASVAAGCPVTFAEETASGPVRPRRSSAAWSSGIRTATVPLVSPRSHRSDGC